MNKKTQGNTRTRANRGAASNADNRADAARAIALAPATVSAKPSAIAAHWTTVPLSLFRKYIAPLLTPLLKRRTRRRKLQLLEMQQLGEKRFVAIVRVGRQKFLIGGAASSVLLLAEIGSRKATVLSPHPLTQESA